MACGNKLVNGELIHKVFKSKTLYLRPSKEIEFESCDEDEKDDSAESVIEITPPVTHQMITELAPPSFTEPAAEPLPAQSVTFYFLFKFTNAFHFIWNCKILWDHQE
ncbi:hypothetical protein E1301_Tti013637 [Triplophysa tibetana]|uniref:Uncharacterized protein n=1 Tax=Triplophysa tibetana TaxID=1572043 RepID=A0A5A9NWJ8_9TELE|nr:hypothetical protein E1301_Tti013637 [Triplophysa tibetana]